MNKIVYLPLARQDIQEITRYIAYDLHSPKAAQDLLDDFEREIKLTADFPKMHTVYPPTAKFRNPYRFIPVKNYLIFYVVLDDGIEIRRIVYGKMDLSKLDLEDK